MAMAGIVKFTAMHGKNMKYYWLKRFVLIISSIIAILLHASIGMISKGGCI